MTWLRRSLSTFALVGGAWSFFACGASESRLEFGASDDAGDAGNASEVPLPPGDEGPPDGATGLDTDAVTQAKCVASSSTTATVCVHVRRAADGPAPAITDASRALGIDGIGALVVMLMPDPWVKSSAPVALRMFPSPSSGTDFKVDSDLPKTADLDVKPGRYFAFAVFYDQPGFASRDVAAGDYVPRMANDWVIPKVDIGAGDAADLEVDLYPVRATDLNVTMSASVHPIGSGTGPLVASLIGPDGTTVIGEGRVSCADVVYGAPVVRLVTTAPPSKTVGADGYGLKVGLYDFAAGPDDPSAGAIPAPPGTIVGWSDGRVPRLVLDDGWVTPTSTVTLDAVIPFTGTVSTDPTPSCTAYGAAPAH